MVSLAMAQLPQQPNQQGQQVPTVPQQPVPQPAQSIAQQGAVASAPSQATPPQNGAQTVLQTFSNQTPAPSDQSHLSPAATPGQAQHVSAQATPGQTSVKAMPQAQPTPQPGSPYADPVPAGTVAPEHRDTNAKKKRNKSNLAVLILIFILPVLILGNAVRLFFQNNGNPNFSALINRNVEFLSVPTNQQAVEIDNFRELEANLSISRMENPRVFSQLNAEQDAVVFHSTRDFLDNAQTQSDIVNVDGSDNNTLLPPGITFFNSRSQEVTIGLQRGEEKVSLIINDNVASELFLEDFPEIRLVDTPFISPNNRYVAMIFTTARQLSVMLIIDINALEVTLHQAPDIDKLVFSKDSSSIIYFSDLDRFLHVYDIATEEVIIDFNTSQQLTSFTSGISHYYTSSSILRGSSTRFFNPEEPEPNQAITVWDKRSFDQKLQIFVFMPDEITKIIPLSDRVLIIINTRGVMNFLNLETEEIEKVITHPDFDNSPDYFHYYPNSIIANSNEDRLIALDRDNMVHIWEMSVR
jgi:WD40 repeat protein